MILIGWQAYRGDLRYHICDIESSPQYQQAPKVTVLLVSILKLTYKHKKFNCFIQLKIYKQYKQFYTVHKCINV